MMFAYLPMLDSIWMCLALSAPISDYFIFLFRLERVNIDWLDNPVVSIAASANFFINLITNIIFTGVFYVLLLPLKMTTISG